MSVHGEAIMVGQHILSGRLQGADYRVTRLSGWWERPNIKRNVLPRELSDGDFLSPWHYEARYISIDGIVECASHEQMHHIMDQLNGLAAYRREWLSIQGHGVTTSALVEADGGGMIQPANDKILNFELRFRAPDPRKYGQEHVVDIGYDNTQIGHFGNYPAAPLVHVRGQGVTEGFSVRAVVDDVARIWRYEYPLTDGDNHRVDFARGVHLVGAARTDVSQRVTRYETWQIPPHTRIPVRTRPVDGVGELVFSQVRFRDTWI